MNQLQKFRNKGTGLFARMLTALSLGMVVVGQAMASTPEFDTSTITAKIIEYTAYGVILYAAYALGKWTLRVFGLVGGKG